MPVGRTAYPAALDIHASDATATEGEFAYVNRLFLTSLSADVNAVVTTFNIPSTTLLSDKGMLVIGNETCEWTAKPTGTTLTVVRGSGGSTASSHTAGDPIGIVPNAAQLNAILAALAQAEKKMGYRTGGANQVPANNTALLGVAAGQTEYKLITPAYTDQSVGRNNVLANAGFEQWTKGPTPAPAGSLQGPDAWIHLFSGASSIVQDTIVPPGGASRYSAKLTNTTATSFIEQKMENPIEYRGIPCVFTGMVRSSVGGPATSALVIRTDTGAIATNFTSPFPSLANTWEQLTIAVTIPLDATEVRLFCINNSVGVAWFDNLYFGPGTAAPAYEPLHPASDLVRCMRRIEKHGGTGGGPPSLLDYAETPGAPVGYSIPFAVPKGGIPTLTKFGTWRAVNCNQPTFDRADAHGYRMWTVPIAIGAWETNADTSLTYLLAEWNP